MEEITTGKEDEEVHACSCRSDPMAARHTAGLLCARKHVRETRIVVMMRVDESRTGRPRRIGTARTIARSGQVRQVSPRHSTDRALLFGPQGSMLLAVERVDGVDHVAMVSKSATVKRRQAKITSSCAGGSWMDSV